MTRAAVVAPRAPGAAVVAPAGSPAAGDDAVDRVLDAVGTTLTPPAAPTLVPYGPDCRALVDPGFSGRCVVAHSSAGTVAGVVEVEQGVTGGGGLRRARGAQERDLVWRRRGDRWALALRRVFQSQDGLTSQVYSSPLPASGQPSLVFITPSTVAGYGRELDVVGGDGQVWLYHFLGQGFVVVPPQGGLVMYVPGWVEAGGPAGAYDQYFVRDLQGSWTVVSQQYVPDRAALARHHGELSFLSPPSGR